MDVTEEDPGYVLSPLIEAIRAFTTCKVVSLEETPCGLKLVRGWLYAAWCSLSGTTGKCLLLNLSIATLIVFLSLLFGKAGRLSACHAHRILECLRTISALLATKLSGKAFHETKLRIWSLRVYYMFVSNILESSTWPISFCQRAFGRSLEMVIFMQPKECWYCYLSMRGQTCSCVVPTHYLRLSCDTCGGNLGFCTRLQDWLNIDWLPGVVSITLCNGSSYFWASVANNEVWARASLWQSFPANACKDCTAIYWSDLRRLCELKDYQSGTGSFHGWQSISKHVYYE